MTDRPGEPETLNREELLQMAIKTARSGNKQSARVMFTRVLGDDPRNERALLWMAQLAKTKVDKRRYLLKTLKVNGSNKTARQELQRMSRTEKARTNRTLIYGALFVAAIMIVLVLGVLAIKLLGLG